MSSHPKFYLRNKTSNEGKHQIILKFSFNGQRLEYYTGISIKPADYNPQYWNTRKKPIRTTAYNGVNFNNDLQSIEADVLKIVSVTKGEDLNSVYVRKQLDSIYKRKAPDCESMITTPEQSFINYFDKSIQDFTEGVKLVPTGKKKGKMYGYRAIKNYGITFSALKRYLKYTKAKDLQFIDINKDFYNDFMKFCYNVENKEVSTFGTYIKCIKAVMVESERHFITKDFYCPEGEADTIYLTTNQIDLVAGLDLSDYSKNSNIRGANVSYQTLDKVRDLFLIGAYTGLRFSDFSQLDINSIGNGFIKLKQLKTGNQVVIPIMSKLNPILNKYPKILPTISNQKFNYYIKEVAKLAGLIEIRTIKNNKGNRLNETKEPLYNLISSHCCRRSYATNMFEAGVPSMLIMSATGHKTETSFLKYIRASNETKAELLAGLIKTLGL